MTLLARTRRRYNNHAVILGTQKVQVHSLGNVWGKKYSEGGTYGDIECYLHKIAHSARHNARKYITILQKGVTKEEALTVVVSYNT